MESFDITNLFETHILKYFEKRIEEKPIEEKTVKKIRETRVLVIVYNFPIP